MTMENSIPKNKHIRVAFAMMVACIGAVHQLRSSNSSLIEPQASALVQIRARAKAHDYDAIYAMLSDTYKNVTTRKAFAEISNRLEWKITKLEMGTLTVYDAISFVPVRATVQRSGGEHEIHTVVFFENVGGRWLLLNFPFAGPELLNFGEIPSWFLQGERPTESRKGMDP